jgi:ABC transporter related protein
MLGALDSPTSGSLTINGNDLTAMSPRELSRFRRDHLGFVFQRSNLVSSLTVMDNALLQLRLQGRLTDSSRRAVEELIDRVGLGDKKTRLPRDLSGGEQQRAAIIRAVASAPALVVADEPTASLDAENAAGVLNVMRALNYELGTTIVVSSHDERVIRVGRRIVRLTDGRVVSDTGSTRER